MACTQGRFFLLVALNLALTQASDSGKSCTTSSCINPAHEADANALLQGKLNVNELESGTGASGDTIADEFPEADANALLQGKLNVNELESATGASGDTIADKLPEAMLCQGGWQRGGKKKGSKGKETFLKYLGKTSSQKKDKCIELAKSDECPYTANGATLGIYSGDCYCDTAMEGLDSDYVNYETCFFPEARAGELAMTKGEKTSQACTDDPSLAGVTGVSPESPEFPNAAGVSSWCTAVMGNPADCTGKLPQWLDGCKKTCGECDQAFTKIPIGGPGGFTHCADPSHCIYDAKYCVKKYDQCGILESQVEEKCGAWSDCGGVVCNADYGGYCLARRTMTQMRESTMWGYKKVHQVEDYEDYVVAEASQSCGNGQDLTKLTCQEACTAIGMKGTYEYGSWGTVGPKCFVHRTGDKSYQNCHWNQATGGSYSDAYRAVCTKSPQAKKEYVVKEVNEEGCTEAGSKITTEDECKTASESAAVAGTYVTKWTTTAAPYGCILWTSHPQVYWNPDVDGKKSGSYKPICVATQAL